MTLEEINTFCADSMIGFLGIEFIELNDGLLKARMPVNERTRQPHGFLHGGAMITLAETVASGVTALRNEESDGVFGYHVDASLVSAVREGFVYASATLAHEGRSSYIWDVTVEGEEGQSVALCRVTVKVVKGRKN